MEFTDTDKPPAIVEVVPARPEQEPILSNLLELYAHDFSEFHEIEPGPDGRFGYNDLPLYWSDPNRHAFLLRIEGKLAGFILIKSLPKASCDGPVWDMTEFFILRRYRRMRAGMEAAHRVWTDFPGLWQVRVMQSNRGAHRFWHRAIATFTRKKAESVVVEKDGKLWQYFLFTATPRVPHSSEA